FFPLFMLPRPLLSTLFPYTTLFRSHRAQRHRRVARRTARLAGGPATAGDPVATAAGPAAVRATDAPGSRGRVRPRRAHRPAPRLDRKSTRLNSSHVKISYAVFCLKK